jgi:hypothetical protein
MKSEPFRFHQWEHPLERLPFTPGYSLERRCTVCGQDEYTLTPWSECPGPNHRCLLECRGS